MTFSDYHAIAQSDREVQFWLGRNRYLLGEKILSLFHNTLHIGIFLGKAIYKIEKVLALQGQSIFLTKIFPSHVNQHRRKLSCETIWICCKCPIKNKCENSQNCKPLDGVLQFHKKDTLYFPTFLGWKTLYLLANEQKIFRTKACQIDA